MREPLEMFTASRMQNIVQIHTKNKYFVIKQFSIFYIFTFRAVGVESPRGGAITVPELAFHKMNFRLP